MPDRGIASGHLVDLSIHVNRYENLLEDGKGPTRSTLDMGKSSEGNRDLLRSYLNMSGNLTTLARKAGMAPIMNIVC